MKRPERFVKQSESDKYIDNIHHCLLIIAKEIKRICEKNNIPYFMLAGTLLGAVRHKGFIPWDDDMDFGMFRDDYNKFLEACKNDLNTDLFFLQNYNTDPNFGYFYTRILLNNTYLNYEYINNVDMKKSLFVDIFPYDSIPESKFLRRKQSIITSFAIRLLKKKLHFNIICYTLAGRIELFFERFFKKETLIKIYEKEMQKYNSDKNTKQVCCANGGAGYPKEIINRSWIAENELMQFEDTSFPGSKQYHEYMTAFYGDYMTLPPENKRYTHEFDEIDFGPYKI